MKRKIRIHQVFFNRLKSNADKMVKSLRESIWILKNQSLSLTALSDRFKVRINRMVVNYSGVDINLKEHIENNLHFCPCEGLHLLRIMEEALTNSLKHANASSIKSGESGTSVQIKIKI